MIIGCRPRVSGALLVLSVIGICGCGSSKSAAKDQTVSIGASTSARKEAGQTSAPQTPAGHITAAEIRQANSEAEAFRRGRKTDTKLVTETDGGLRETVRLRRHGTRVCVGIEVTGPSQGLTNQQVAGEAACDTTTKQYVVSLVMGNGATGAILNIGGYGKCDSPVIRAGNSARATTKGACVASPFPYRLVVIPSAGAVQIYNAGAIHVVHLSRFHCSQGEPACILGVLPNGSPA